MTLLHRLWSVAKSLVGGVVNAVREIFTGVAGIVAAPVTIPLALYRGFRSGGYGTPSSLALTVALGPVMIVVSWGVTLLGIPVGAVYALCEGVFNAGVALLRQPTVDTTFTPAAQHEATEPEAGERMLDSLERKLAARGHGIKRAWRHPRDGGPPVLVVDNT